MTDLVPDIDSDLVLPPLARATRPRKLNAVDDVLDNGLATLVVRRPSVPMVELRLRIPLPAANSRTADAASARGWLMSGSMLFGTRRRNRQQLADALASVGADLGVGVDSDRVMLSTAVLRTGLREVLEVLADVLTGATYPGGEVTAERTRLGQRIAMARTQPGVIARQARAARLYGDHPYGRTLPDPDVLAAVEPAVLRRLHRDRVRPEGATLVVVGDVTPARVNDLAGKALAEWTGAAGTGRIAALPDFNPAGITLVDRPGAVQSNLRLGGHGLSRGEDGYAALQLANLVLGGYFSSRLTENLRERNGFTYTPHSGLDQSPAGSSLLVDADVASEVTAQALHETWYELGRMSLAPVTADELDSARRYALGTLAMSTATQAGLASMLSALVGQDLDPSWLVEHQRALAGVSIEEVQAVARRHFAVSSLATVVVGDAERVADSLRALGSLTMST